MDIYLKFLNQEEEEEEERSVSNFNRMVIIRSSLFITTLFFAEVLSPRARFPRISKVQSTITRWLNVIITTRTILTVLNDPAAFECLFKAIAFYETLPNYHQVQVKRLPSRKLKGGAGKNPQESARRDQVKY